MGRYLVRRILWMIPVLLFISVVTFALAHAVPGGPFDREKPLPAEIKANLAGGRRLTSVPDSIGQLTDLKELYCYSFSSELKIASTTKVDPVTMR